MNKITNWFQEHKIITIIISLVLFYPLTIAAYMCFAFWGRLFSIHFTDSMQSACAVEFSAIVFIVMLMGLVGQLRVFRGERVPFFKGAWTGGFMLFFSLLSVILSVQGCIEEGYPLNSPGTMLFYLIYFAGVGIFEEFFFRGIIADLLIRLLPESGFGVWCAAVLSGVIFGLMHLSNGLGTSGISGVIIQAVAASVIGIMIAAVYFRTRNIWVVVFLHALNDVAASIGISFFNSGMEITDVIGEYDLQSLVSVIPFAASAIILLRKNKMQEILALWEPERSSDMRDML